MAYCITRVHNSVPKMPSVRRLKQKRTKAEAKKREAVYQARFKQDMDLLRQEYMTLPEGEGKECAAHGINLMNEHHFLGMHMMFHMNQPTEVAVPHTACMYCHVEDNVIPFVHPAVLKNQGDDPDPFPWVTFAHHGCYVKALLARHRREGREVA